MNSPGLLLAFYGDDFTGSTDAMEVLTRAGARTVLFIEPPTRDQLEKYGKLDAIGVAGNTRSLVPSAMKQVLQPAFEKLRALGASHVHYKVCSTFDSSPQIGSIGAAIDTAAEIFNQPFIPLVVAAPSLGRYCVFGNLFARLGIGSQGNIYRLDRHPSMSRHPVTPADESDLRLHLSKQTAKSIGLMDILQVVAGENEACKILETKISDGEEVILFDALYPEQMAAIGKLIHRYARADQPLFSVGSSGMEMALTENWIKEKTLVPPASWDVADVAEPLLVLSGSCSPVTSAQISYALENGFVEVSLDTMRIAEGDKSIASKSSEQVVRCLHEGKNVIVHTSRGTSDARVEKTNSIFIKKGFDNSTTSTMTSALYGNVLGTIACNAAAQTKLKRVVLSGGDTSSYAARSMGIEAVEMKAPLCPGAPLCKAYAPGSPVDGLEIIVKGGQVGAEDFFILSTQ